MEQGIIVSYDNEFPVAELTWLSNQVPGLSSLDVLLLPTFDIISDNEVVRHAHGTAYCDCDEREWLSADCYHYIQCCVQPPHLLAGLFGVICGIPPHYPDNQVSTVLVTLITIRKEIVSFERGGKKM